MALSSLHRSRLVLLRRWLQDTGLSYRRIALLLDLDVSYLAKVYRGAQPLTDSLAWKLQTKLLCPMSKLEKPIDLSDL